MASLIICTPGGATDNSYLTAAQADAYFANSLRNTAWTAQTAENRERALIQATAEIEELGGGRSVASPARLRFSGSPYSTDATVQALHFPRTSDTTAAGVKQIPQAVRVAVCEQAMVLLEKMAAPDLVDHATLRGNGLSIVSMDGVYLQYSAAAEVVPPGIAPLAWQSIRQFIRRTRGTAV